MRKKLIFTVLGVILMTGSVLAEGISLKEAYSYYNKGVELQEAGEFVQAIGYYQKTLLMAPEETQLKKNILNNMGVMYCKQGNLPRAEELFRQVLSIDPEYLTAKLNLGLIYDLRGQDNVTLRYWLAVFNLDIDEFKPKDFVVAQEEEFKE